MSTICISLITEKFMFDRKFEKMKQFNSIFSELENYWWKLFFSAQLLETNKSHSKEVCAYLF